MNTKQRIKDHPIMQGVRRYVRVNSLSFDGSTVTANTDIFYTLDGNDITNTFANTRAIFSVDFLRTDNINLSEVSSDVVSRHDNNNGFD